MPLDSRSNICILISLLVPFTNFEDKGEGDKGYVIDLFSMSASLI